MNVLVIGSGFSSLASACYLAQKGYSVTILEKNAEIGGRARQLKKDGLVFAGIDIIQDKLIEVNGLSPGGIGRINYLSHTALEIPIIEKILNIA